MTIDMLPTRGSKRNLEGPRLEFYLLGPSRWELKGNVVIIVVTYMMIFGELQVVIVVA